MRCAAAQATNRARTRRNHCPTRPSARRLIHRLEPKGWTAVVPELSTKITEQRARRQLRRACRSLALTRSDSNRPGRRAPLPPEQPEHPRVRYLTVHDAVFSQRPFTHESELLQDAGGCHVARIGLGLDSIQVERVECPLQQSARAFRRVAVTPCRIVEAVAQ